MHNIETLQNGGYKDEGLLKLKLTCPLASFPVEILGLGQTLEQLDLSGTGISSLPWNFGNSLPNLKIAFFSQCAFTIFPKQLASCPQLEMVAFRGNGITTITEDALPPRLRWLILTDNKLAALPKSIGKCERLQKCMLAGNRLESLPEEMKECKRLGLLRLSANRLPLLPNWLFEMPELAFLSFAGNPCSVALIDTQVTNGNGTAVTNGTNGANGAIKPNGDDTRSANPALAQVAWSDLDVFETLGEGASGVISKGLWQVDAETKVEVAIKLFKGNLTSDGTPEDEMAACIAAGQQDNIIDVLGRIHGHPDEDSGAFKGGLVMQLIPPHYQTLGQPPSLQSCTRDNYPADARLSIESALASLRGIAAAAAHLHSKGIAHGDLYAHNILTTESHALLGDFGAATVYGKSGSPLLEGLEVLAYAHLIEDVTGLVPKVTEHEEVLTMLRDLHKQCSTSRAASRIRFNDVVQSLASIAGVARQLKLIKSWKRAP